MLKTILEGEGLRMVRNPNFYNKERPYLDGYDVLSFKDVTTQRTALSSGQIDSYLTADPQEAKDLQKATKGLKLVETGSTSYNSFWMNAEVAPWKDARVRRAMSLSMNRDEYIQLIGKGLGKHAGPVVPVFGEYALSDAELKKLQPYDVAEAKKLFEAAGVKEVAFTHPTSSTMNDYVNIMVKQLQAIGVTAKPQPLDAAAWVAQYFGNKLTASYSLNQSYKTPDSALLWYRTGGVTGSGNYDTKLYSAALDALIDKAAATIPEAERKAAYLEAQRAVVKSDPAFINVFNQGSNVVYHEKVQNFDAGAGAMTAHMTRDYWIDA
jgi:peptide/nickel transport system substrate-binding protein